MFFRGLIAVFLLLISGSCAWAQYAVTGRVLDNFDQPLEGANVILSGMDNGDATGENGQFAIQNVPEGEYQLEVSFVGFSTFSRKVKVGGAKGDLSLTIKLRSTTTNLDQLVVRANRANEKTPVTYQDIGREEIESANLGQDVPFLLRWSPSAVVTSDAGTGIGYTGIRIRGTDPTRINVTINGIPLNDSESQGVFWVNLPDFLSSVSSIQIQRGAGTSTNGAGAFGATVNLNTFEMREDPYVTLSGTLGSFNTRKGNIQLGTGLLNDRFVFNGRLSTIQSDGYIDRASADLNSYALNGTYLGNNNSLTFNIFSGHEITYQAWYGVPADLVENEATRTTNTAGTQKAGEPYDNEVDNYRQTHYQLLFNQDLGNNWILSLNGHYTTGRGFFEQYVASQILADYGIQSETPDESTDLIRRLWLDNDFYGATYSLNYQPSNNKWDFVLGGAYNIYEGLHFGEVIWARDAGDSEVRDRYYENDARKTDFNIYTKLNYNLTEKLNAYLDLQYRSVGYEFLGRDIQLNSVDQQVDLNFFNPKVGLVYQVNPASSVYASFAVAQREPNRNDFVASTPDNRPKSERLDDYELGWRYTSKKGRLEANIYYMDYTNQLAVNGQLNEVGEAIRVNIADSYRLGLELNGGVALSERFSIQGNATFSQNRINSFTEFVDAYDADFNFVEQRPVLREDTDLALSPNIIAGGGFTYQVFNNETNAFSINWLTKYVGKQFIDNASDENSVLDAYSFTDIRLSYEVLPKFMKRMELTLMVRNVFDQLFEANAYSYRFFLDEQITVDRWLYPQAGANFLLGLRLDL